ncbi:hypothetical protein E2562_031874 [Oryza meyeriana var. granulata]|uniref:Isopenicillin N synthase-like Fe(2+) 2OG dioxygenase domain-containing protein n=1 Tax=Oryza meyeriana var. granulata TaxID=110450 RepID=A0A6G1F0A3_9ORYZ|nr:hypothetical protein E2562_031874 [Oryza meyeriana var. granulata]
MGLSPHTNAGGVTLLLQVNDVQGLQIKKDGKWISGALFFYPCENMVISPMKEFAKDGKRLQFGMCGAAGHRLLPSISLSDAINHRFGFRPLQMAADVFGVFEVPRIC